MSNSIYTVSSTSRVATTVVNRTLRNTYALLGMLFVFAAGTAFVAQALHVRIGFWPFLIGIFALSFAISKTRNSGWGLVWAFAFAGLLGVVTGSNVDAMLYRYSNGGELAVASFGLTAGIFFALSAYAMNTKRDFSGWFAFLAVGTIAVIGAFILNWFLQIPALCTPLGVVTNANSSREESALDETSEKHSSAKRDANHEEGSTRPYLTAAGSLS